LSRLRSSKIDVIAKEERTDASDAAIKVNKYKSLIWKQLLMQLKSFIARRATEKQQSKHSLDEKATPIDHIAWKEEVEEWMFCSRTATRIIGLWKMGVYSWQ
jgi:hypothetical protein